MTMRRKRRPTAWMIGNWVICSTVALIALLGFTFAIGMGQAHGSPAAPALTETASPPISTPTTTPTPTTSPTPTTAPTPAPTTSPAVTGSDAIAAVCAQAGKFTEESRPRKAVLLIESLSTSPAEPATGASLPCQRELDAAVLRISTADRLAVAAVDAAAAANNETASEAKDEAKTKAKNAATAALTLDADNPQASQLAAQLSRPSGWATRTWRAVQDRYAQSWSALKDILLAWLALLLGVMVAVRIALPIFPVHDRDPLRRLAINAQWVILLGFVAVASGSLLILLDGWHFISTITAVIVTVLGAVLLAYGWSRAMRISISVMDSQGKNIPSAEGHVIALLSQLGGAPPRGVETPRGADTTVLQSAGLVSAPDLGGIVKALYAVAQAVVPATPWRVRVDVEDIHRHCITITRNGRSVLGAVIDRDELGLRVKCSDASGQPRSSDSENDYPDLHRMSAAVVLCALQQEYGFGGLCGAKNWRSLGLHYIATNDFASDRQSSIALLTRAVKEDRDNRLARVALWHEKYRDSTRADELATYAALLDGYVQQRLQSEPDRPAPADQRDQVIWERHSGDQALMLRVLFSRVAAGVNYWAVEDEYFPADISGEPHSALRDAQDQLKATNAHCAQTRGICQEFARDNSRAVEFMCGSAVKPEGELPQDAITARECYLYACVQASLYAQAEQQQESELAKSHAEAAVAYLKRADCDPGLRSWRRHDPQLKLLREQSLAYREEFGRPAYSDTEFLDQVAELGPFKSRLQALGLTTPQTLAGMGAYELQTLLEVPRVIALRITQIAHLANFETADQTADLANWRVDIALALLALGVTSIPAGTGYAEKVLDTLRGQEVKSLPELEQLQRLLDGS